MLRILRLPKENEAHQVKMSLLVFRSTERSTMSKNIQLELKPQGILRKRIGCSLFIVVYIYLFL